MSERATAHTITMQPASHAQGGTDIAVRPKVLRRPAHFSAQSTMAAPVPTFVPILASASSEEKSESTGRVWQDDGRFAAALLAIVIFVNIAVSAWLSSITPTHPVSIRATEPLMTVPAEAVTPTIAPEDTSTAISEQ